MTHYSLTCYSLDEYADKCKEFGGKPEYVNASSFNGNASFDDALSMARQGWSKHLQTTLDVAESAVSMCDQEYEMTAFMPVHDVCGTDVDIDRFLSGEPECMIEYPAALISKVGKVITMCASVSYSAAVSTSTIIRRGQTISALAMALSQMGHATEIWLDVSGTTWNGDSTQIRVLVKGPNDTIDPERILFAFSHPASLRQLGFAAEEGMSGGKCHPSNTRPRPPAKDLPEGTIYLPEILSGSDVPDAHIVLEQYLRELELIA